MLMLIKLRVWELEITLRYNVWLNSTAINFTEQNVRPCVLVNMMFSFFFSFYETSDLWHNGYKILFSTFLWYPRNMTFLSLTIKIFFFTTNSNSRVFRVLKSLRNAGKLRSPLKSCDCAIFKRKILNEISENKRKFEKHYCRRPKKKKEEKFEFL